jgi:hypothetical protein
VAGNPAPAAVSVQLLVGDAAIDPWLDRAAELIEREFPRPAMQTTAGLLRWHLTGIAFMTKVQEQKLTEEGLPYAAIATALGLSIAAIKVRIHRARIKLRQLCNPMEDEP